MAPIKTSRRLALAVTCAVAVFAPAAPVSAAPAPAEAIVLERSGGLAGKRDTVVVDRSTAGGRRSLRVAGSTEFRSLHGSYRPRNSCCDLYSYRVTVSYGHGRVKTVTAVQGASAPRILWYTINEVQRVGRQSPDALPRKIG